MEVLIVPGKSAVGACLAVLLAACSTKSPDAAPPAPSAGANAAAPANGVGGGADGGASDPLLDAIAKARAALARGDTSIDLDGDGETELTVTYAANGGLGRVSIDASGDGTDALVWDLSSIPRRFTEKDHGTITEVMEVTPNANDPNVVAVESTLTPLLSPRRRGRRSRRG